MTCETDYCNNIIQNYEKYVLQLVECNLDKAVDFERIKNDNHLTSDQKTNAKNQINRRCQLVVTDILCLVKVPDVHGNMVYNYQSGLNRDSLDEMKSMAVPPKPVFHSNSVLKDVEQFPCDYFHSMLEIMIHLESWYIPVANVFPLKTSLIPGHYLFDTTALVEMLYPYDVQYDYVIGNQTDYKSRGDIKKDGYLKDNQDLLWNLFFHLRSKKNKRIFHSKRVLDDDDLEYGYVDNHNFTFHHQIKTDGKSCSVVLVKKTHARASKPKSPKREPIVEPYIHQITPQQRLVYQTMRLTCIDPNMEDLLSSVSMDAEVFNDQQEDQRLKAIKEQRRWRYTNNQRRFETKSKIRSKALLKEKKQCVDIFGVTIQAREAELSLHSKKSLTFAAFRKYIFNKNKLNKFVGPFYQEIRHRSRRFKAYSLRQKSESLLILNFKKKHGGPSKTIIGMGDWCDSHHRRFHAPVKGVGFRALFRKAGYHVLLVDEYNSSAKCCYCQNVNARCRPFRWVKNKKRKSRHRRPWTKCHGLVRCTTCSRLCNRDPNAATNQWIAGNAAINGQPRPHYLRRGIG